jgi:hypothetical protein
MAGESDFVRVQTVCRRPHRGGPGVDLRPVREGFVVDELLLWQVYVKIFGIHISVITMPMLDILITSFTNDDSVPKYTTNKADSLCTVRINVTLRRVPVTFVAMEKR